LIRVLFLGLRHRPLSRGEQTLAALLAAGAGILLLTSHPGGSQIYFLWYGYAAGTLLSAIGLSALIDRIRTEGLWPVAMVGAELGLALATTLGLATGFGEERYAGNSIGLIYATFFSILLLAAWLVVWLRRRRAAAAPATGIAVAVLVGAALLGVAALDETVDRVVPPALISSAGTPNYRVPDPPNERGLSLELGQAPRWLRDNSDPDDVIAVDNQITTTSLTDTSDGANRFAYYAAYAERRTYLGGFGYSSQAVATSDNVYQFPERREVNETIFDPEDCEELRSAVEEGGVSFAFHDGFNQDEPDRLGLFLNPVFENGSATIYRGDDLTDCRFQGLP